MTSQNSEIFKKMMLSGELLSWSPMKFCTDVGILIESYYLEFGELLDLHLCSCQGSIDQDLPHQNSGCVLVTTPEYMEWWSRRVNDNILVPSLEGKIERLESALQNCELRIEHLEARERHWKEELHHFQDQVRNRDYLMGEAIAQIREVVDHLQTLTV
ncbi:hypothetical protein J1N35_024727 [Gossypium stocksii]|uniref:Uncharacterized protein n=1 Tax=Gossypium stocksii TaxID=47602 RepID=A0A9D3V534_9ROSI|nr:hypothetical protein J1N35_024727 [Gossypium stocksii]